MSPISIPGKVTLAQTQVFPDDLDAVTYVSAVEAVDGQTLEPDVRLAYNTFIKGCKTDGIWDAIKASCILAGARTLAGALVPLKGTAPFSSGFSSINYDREIGLKADLGYYLETGRPHNQDPQNNRSACVYVATLPTTGTVLLGQNNRGSGGSTLLFTTLTRCSSNPTDSISGFSGSFLGVSRNISTSYTRRFNSTNTTVNASSSTPDPANYMIFRDTGSGFDSQANARLSFYSIGESLDLALLDSRVSTLMTDIGAAIP